MGSSYTKKLTNDLKIHRYKNGRLEIDYFSRELRPKYTLIKLDNKYYDRVSLKKFLNDRVSSTVPESVRMLNAREIANAKNNNPFRIFGKSKFFNS